MKKTTPISISQTLFYVEDDAYQKLSNYLEEVKKYFSSYEDNKEIIEDIESRIREQFLQFGEEDKSERIVTLSHVDRLIKAMGWPQEFGEFENTPSENVSKKTTKRLYRDQDNAIIAGVASGIAAFFGIDPLIVRGIFFISIFFGGVGFITYIFLWFVLPAAETPTQKLEMQGDRVTLEEVKKVVEEKISAVDNEKIKSGFKKFFEDLRSFLFNVFGNAFKILGKIVGVVLKIFSGIGIAFMLAFLSLGLMSGFSTNMFSQFSSLPSFYVLVIFAFLIGIIPFWFINKLGNVFLRRKSTERREYSTALFVIWMVAIFAGPSLFFSVGDNYVNEVRSRIDREEIVTEREVQDFTSLVLRNSQHVNIVQGEEVKMEVRGTEEGINKLVFEERDGKLTISKKDDFKFCFFCPREKAEIYITTPDINELLVSNGSRVDLSAKLDDLILEAQNASSVLLEGTATKLNLLLENGSRIDAEEFVTEEGVVEISNGSKAILNVTKKLSGEITNGSSLTQHGAASTENLETSSGSAVKTRVSVVE